MVIATALGLNESAVKRCLVRLGHKGTHPSSKSAPSSPPSPATPDLVSEETDDKLRITAVVRIGTVAAAIEKGAVDTTIWEPVRTQVTSWEVGMKLKDGDGAERVHVEPLWRVFVEFRRKVPRNIEKAAEAWLASLQGRLPAFPAVRISPKVSAKQGHLFEISISDAHFAKLAWSGDTGNSYDLNIARESFLQAASALLSEVEHLPVSEILLPLGNDLFHIDSDANTTAGGTPQDVDSRFTKMAEVGIATLVETVELARKKAPVRVLYVPGNHDLRTSWWATRVLRAHFRGLPDVFVDADARSRKYHLFGKTLVGFTHGCEEAHRDLPNIMAGEEPEKWARSQFREWHLGHFHKVKETRHVAADSFGGVVVRVLPSISGTDRWHYSKGYTGQHRAAQGFLYSQENGLRAQYTAVVGR